MLKKFRFADWAFRNKSGRGRLWSFIDASFYDGDFPLKLAYLLP